MLWLDTALDTPGKRCDVLLPSTIHLLFVGPARVKVRVGCIRIPTAYADHIQSGAESHAFQRNPGGSFPPENELR